MNHDINSLVNGLASAIVARLIEDIRLQLTNELKGIITEVRETKNLPKEEGTIAGIKPAVIPKSSVPTKPTVPAKPNPPSKPTPPSKASKVIASPLVELDEDKKEDKIDLFIAKIETVTEENLKELDALPLHFVEGLRGLSNFDRRGLYTTLAVFPPDQWLNILTTTNGTDFVALLEAVGFFDEKTVTKGSAFLKNLFDKVNKLAKKKEREYAARQANLKKLEADKRKREEAAKKKEELLNAEKARKEALLVTPEKAIDEPNYTPNIPKPNRIKVGIIGIKGDGKTIIESEFGKTFNLSMADSGDGLVRCRAVGESSSVVFMLKKFISHTHVDNIEKDKIVIVEGAMSSLREQLSTYAKQVYQTNT